MRLEERLGYAHKGIERLMAGSELTSSAHLAGRNVGRFDCGVLIRICSGG